MCAVMSRRFPPAKVPPHEQMCASMVPNRSSSRAELLVPPGGEVRGEGFLRVPCRWFLQRQAVLSGVSSSSLPDILLYRVDTESLREHRAEDPSAQRIQTRVPVFQFLSSVSQ